MATFAGEVEVTVTPDTSKFGPELEAKVIPAAVKVAERVGQMMGATISRKVADGVRDGIDRVNASSAGAKAGNAFGRGFAAAANTKIRQSLRDQAVNVEVKVDSASITQLRTQLRSVRDKDVTVRVNVTAALANLERLRVKLVEVGATRPTVRVDVDAAAARAELAGFRSQITRLPARKNIDVGVSGAGGARAGVLALTAAIAGLGPALIPVGAAAVGAFAAIGAGAVAAAAGVGVLALAMGPVLGAVQAVRQAQDQSAQASRGGAAAALQAAGAQDAVTSAVRGLRAAELDAADARVRADERVAESKRALAAAQDDAAQGRVDSARRVADAEERLDDVLAQAARDQVASGRRVADARRQLADVQARAADRQVQAARRVQQADRQLADAQRGVTDAQGRLNDARRQAVRDAEDLASAVAAGALDELDAQDALASAQARLNEYKAAGFAADDQSMRQAQRDFDRARLQLSDLTTRNGRLAEEKAASDQAGVDGSRAVADAQQALIDAQRRVVDAQQAAADAARDAADEQVQAARDVADAQQAAADAAEAAALQQSQSAEAMARAQRDVADAQQESARRQADDAEKIADAQRGIVEAVRESAVQQRRSADSIAAAQQAVEQAHRGVAGAAQSAGAAGGSAMETARRKLAALSPAGREFVRFVTGELMPAFKGLSQEAQTGFLPGLQSGLTSLMPQFGGLRTFVGGLAKTMGDLARDAGVALTSPFWRDFFDYIGQIAGPTVDAMGRTLGNFATGFAGLLEAFEPVRKQISDGVLELSRRFSDFGKGAGSNSGLQSFIAYIRENGPKVAAAFGSLISGAAHIVESLAPIGGVVLGLVTAFGQLIAALDPTVIQAVVLGVLAVATAIGVMNAVMALNPVVLVVVALVALGAALVAAYDRSAAFRTAVDVVWEALKRAYETVKAAVEPALMSLMETIRRDVIPALSAFASAVAPIISWLVDHLAPIVRTVFATIIKVIDGALRIISGVINVVTGLITGDWTRVWDGIKGIASGAWEIIKSVVSGALTIISGLFSTIGGTIKGVWNQLWEDIKSLASLAWDAIKDKAKTPIKFVIETIINEGVLGTYNKIAKFFHAPTVDLVPLPKMLERGGRLPGYGGGDRIPAMLEAGETVVPKHLTPVFASAFSAAGIPGFASGGLIGSAASIFADPVGSIRSAASSAIAGLSRFGSGPFLDLLAAVPRRLLDAIADGIKNLMTGGDRGDEPAGGMGWRRQWELVHAQFPGAVLTSAYRPGSITSSGNQSYHALGRAIDVSPDMRIFNWISEMFGAASKELIFTPAGGRQIKNGRPFVYGGQVAQDHYNHVHWAYDQGGYLPEGLSLAFNGTGRPEPTLPGDQLDNALRRIEGLGGGPSISANVVVNNPVPETASESTTRMMRRLASIGPGR